MHNIRFCYIHCHKASSQIHQKAKAWIALPRKYNITVKSRGRQKAFSYQHFNFEEKQLKITDK